MHYIYLFTDPRNNAPFYVGFTKNVLKRFKQHNKAGIKYSEKNKNVRKNKLLLELENLGYGFDDIVTVLAETETKEEAHKIEIEMIAKFGRIDKKEGPLLNMSDGGEGGAFFGELNGMFGKVSPFKGKHHSPEVKIELSKHAKKRWEGKSFEEFFGSEKASKIRKASAEARLGSKHSDEAKNKIRDSKLGKKATTEQKSKRKERMLSQPTNAKDYKLVSPDGTEYITNGKGLAALCRDLGLSDKAAKAFQKLARVGRTTSPNSFISGWAIHPLK